MLNSISATGKSNAASYALNQLYYGQSNFRSSGSMRVYASSPIEQYFQSAASGIAAFLKSAKSLKQSAQSLLSPDQSAFQSRTAATTDKTAATASASRGASLKTYRVQVGQLASAQSNSGSFLSAASPTAVQAGTNELRITANGKSTLISASIADGDTNGQALTKLKDAINKAKAGVTASIVTDKATGNQKLELTGERTGAGNGFSLEDVTGNAVAATGIATVQKSAADAMYSVNGGASRSSAGNEIELEKGKATATLLKAGAGEIEIRIKPDEAGTLQQVKQLVTDYNAVHKRLTESGAYLQSSVKRGLENAAGGYDAIGIVKKSDGTLALDEEKFKAALSTRFEQTRDAVTGRFGLADKLSQAANRFENVPPSALVNARVRGMQAFTAYQPAVGSYWQLQGRGLLFDASF